MVNAALEQELHEQLEQLPVNRQQEVVDFARSLSLNATTQRGVGANLLPLAGTISKEDLELMSQAIEEAFGYRYS